MQRINGFYGHIQRNNMRSVVMFFGFALACQVIGIAVLFAPLMLVDPGHSPVFHFYGYLQRYSGPVFFGTLMLFSVRFFLHVRQIKQDLNFRIVSRMQEQRLWRIIEIQAIGAGIAMPQIGIIENDARNAFACGMNERSAVVVVTRGLLRTLDDEELEAVVSHEISHIVNGDIRMLAVANVMLSTLSLIRKHNPLTFKGPRQFLVIAVMPAFLIVFLLSGLVTSMAMTLGMLTRLLIASSREFIADAEAVRMTKNPAALISALTRIEGHSEIIGLDETLDAMMIDGAVEGAYATHPTIAERIAVLTQHAGAMALGTGRRKDTRTFADLGPGKNGAFGRRVQMPTKAIAEPKKGLIKRVNAGSNVDAFGLTKRNRNIVIAVLLLPMVFGGFALVTGLTPGHKKLAAAIKGGVSRDLSNSHPRPNRNDPDVIARRARVDKLRETDPLEARCFAGKRYAIGDLGWHAFKKPDDAIVADILNGTENNGRIRVERYAAIHTKSNRDVHRASNPKTQDYYLSQYIAKRKSIVVIMHRFYDDAGFEWMNKVYQSDSDKNVIAIINERLKDGKKLGKSERENREIALLVSHPEDFIPCYVRDGIEQAKKARTASIDSKVE